MSCYSRSYPDVSVPQVDQDPPETLENLHACVKRVDLDITFYTSPSNDYVQASDFVCPRVRRSPPSKESVQHLETVSCWKNLSRSTALELNVWHQLFQACLSIQIKGRLLQAMVDYISGLKDPDGEFWLVPRMRQYLDFEPHHQMRVDVQTLVRDMVSQFYDDRPGETAPRNFAWSIDTADLPSLVYNFVRTQECIFDTIDGPCIVFDIMHANAEDALTVQVQLQWKAPKFKFDVSPAKEGKLREYYVKPHHNNASLGVTWCRGFKIYSDHVEYNLKDSTLPLYWDAPWRCFEVPKSWQEAQVSLQDQPAVTTIVAAEIETLFPKGVTFRRCSRYLIETRIDKGKESSGRSGENDDSTSSVWRDIICDRNQLNNHGVRASSVINDLNQSCRYPPSPLPSPVLMGRETSPVIEISPSKRRLADINGNEHDQDAIQRVEHPDLETESKRRRLDKHENVDPNDNEDSEWLDTRTIQVTTGLLGEANNLPAYEESVWYNRLDAPKLETSPKKLCVKSAAVRHTTFPWRPCNSPHSLSPSTTSSHDNLSPGAGSQTRFSEGKLSQAEIKRNYDEFERRCKEKAAEKAYYAATIPGFDGVVSPTDEHDVSFERIFLDDGAAEDWEDEGDAASEAMEYCD